MRPYALILLALALAGCARPDPGQTGAAGFETPPPAEAVPAAATPYEFHTRITDGAYEHARLDAAPQATIVWHNAGSQTHSVVSDEGTFAGSGPIAPGSTFTFTFQTPGDHAYHCRYHPDMTGLVVVR